MKRQREGQALILTVVSMGVLMAMMAAGISIGTAYAGQDALTAAVNVGALAAARAEMDGDPGAPSDQLYLVTQNDPAAQAVTATVDSAATLVTVSAMARVPGGFAALFHIPWFTVHATAEAQYGPGPALNYAIFQGSQTTPLSLSGDITVHGSVRSNSGVNLGGNVSISGAVLAAKTVTTSGSASMGSEQEGVSIMAMPNWQSMIADMTQSGTVYNNTPWTGCASGSSVYDGGSIIVNNASVTISGQCTFGTTASGPATLWVNGGNVTISGSSTFSGSLIVTNGSITISGNSTLTGDLIADGGSITLSGSVTEGSGGVALAALGSGQEVEMSGTEPVNGFVYAPEGQVVTSGNQTVNGDIAALNVEPSGNLTVNGQAVTAIPSAFESVSLVLPN